MIGLDFDLAGNFQRSYGALLMSFAFLRSNDCILLGTYFVGILKFGVSAHENVVC